MIYKVDIKYVNLIYRYIYVGIYAHVYKILFYKIMNTIAKVRDFSSIDSNIANKQSKILFNRNDICICTKLITTHAHKLTCQFYETVISSVKL